MPSAADFAAHLGLSIRDPELFGRALVHSSYLHEHRDAVGGHNERLEYLGDAVVSLAISTALYDLRPGDDEGALSARRAAIVSTTGLARLANRLDLGTWLLLGEGESQRGGRLRPSLLASAFEAVAGATGSSSSPSPSSARRRPWAASRAPRAASRSTPSDWPASGRPIAWSMSPARTMSACSGSR
jgi:dsRNA-specific ribonuclease